MASLRAGSFIRSAVPGRSLFPQSQYSDIRGTSTGAVNNRPSSYGSPYGSDIMGKYENIYNSLGNPPNFNFTATAPGPYQSTADYTNAFSNLSNLSRTGGFSPEDIANIRARAISPIRAVYANANRNLSRSKALQGGYSPNYAAATAKMSRDMSSQLSDATTNAEADIAGKVAANKMSASSDAARLAAEDQATRNNYALKAADFTRQLDMDKLQKEMEMWQFPIKTRMSALSGMSDFFGKMGNQQMSEDELNDRIANNRFGRTMKLYDMFS